MSHNEAPEEYPDDTRHAVGVSEESTLLVIHGDHRMRNGDGSTDLLELFPKHECGMHIQHNDHKNIYQSASQWIVENDWCDWDNDDAKQRAIETNEIWTIQWYPNTPVGFNALAAPTLVELLNMANKH